MLLNGMPNYVKMHGRCVTLVTARSSEAFPLQGTEKTFPVCATRWREMKGAGGVAGNNSGTAGFTYCPAGASAGRRTTASETSCMLFGVPHHKSR